MLSSALFPRSWSGVLVASPDDVAYLQRVVVTRGPTGPVSGRELGSSLRTPGLIRVTSRVGVWGFVVALVPPLADALGAPVAPHLVGPISSFGLISSGLGTIAASVLVWRSLPRSLSALKLAAGVGAPFGFGLVLGGIALLRPLSAFADTVNAVGWIMLALAVTVVVLLIVALFASHPD